MSLPLSRSVFKVSGFLLASCACVALYGAHAYSAPINTDDVLLALPQQGSGVMTQVAGMRPVIDVADIKVAANSDNTSRMAGPAGIRGATISTPIVDDVAPVQVAAATVSTSVPVPAAGPVRRPDSNPVDYSADRADFNQETRVATLSGSVELKQDGRMLQADQITYYLKDDVAVAEGNVIITEASGEVYYAESVEMSDKMRQGLVRSMFVEMSDGSRIWAAEGRKVSPSEYAMTDARYTACKPCEENPEKRPPWQIHAGNVRWLKEEQRVEYENAWFEMGGVPFFYTPYFSHPDGTVEQKSGLLTPDIGWNSDLGSFYGQSYYWGISPSFDMTFTAMAMTKQAPLLRHEMRGNFGDVYFTTDISGTHSNRSFANTSVTNLDKKEFRGHVFAHGGWNINELWRARANIETVSDRQYLRQYGISEEDILTSSIYAERFKNRNYALIKGMAFQDLRENWRNIDQPNILPVMQMSMLGDPNATLGGRWGWDSSVLSLVRDGRGQDVFRASSRVNWERRDVAPIGLVLTSQLGLRGDAYWTNNREQAKLYPGESKNTTMARFIPNAQFTTTYPLQRNFRTFQLRVEPTATLYAAPHVKNDKRVPNEDSQDLQLTAANLFEGSRFTGIDRVEDNVHVAYGIRTGFYQYNGGELSAFVGQSFDITDDQKLYPAGSGLDKRSSDYVGDVRASFDGGRHSATYRFRLDSNGLSAKQHELMGYTKWGPVAFDGTYFYTRGAKDTAYSDTREQLQLGSTIDLNEMWQVRGYGVYDFSPSTSTSDDKGLRRAVGQIAYNHECYNIAMTFDRNLSSRNTGSSDTTVMLRLGLKNLGAYETGSFSLPSGSSGSTNN